MGNYFKDIVSEKDPATRKKNLEALIAERSPSEILVLTILSIVSNDDEVRRTALERLDARNQAEGNTSARVATLIQSWRREGAIMTWPEPMDETHKTRAAAIEAAHQARAPLSSAVQGESEPQHSATTSPLPDARAGAINQDATPHVVEKRFEGWDYPTVREIEELCGTLPVLPRSQAMKFFEQAGSLTKKEIKVVERQKDRVFESLSGVVSSSDRRDFTVTYDLTSQSPAYGILMLETYDDIIGTLFCVARVSETSFLTHGFTRGEKSAIKNLRNSAPGSHKNPKIASVMDPPQTQGTKRCPFCAEEIQAEAVKCRFCGQWLSAPAATGPSITAPTSGPAPPTAWQPPLPPQSSGIYAEGFNLQSISPEARSKYAQHTLTNTFAVAGVIVLGIITANIFTTIYFALKHGKLPRIASDDPSGGKAVGFIFIPLFNLYWIFFMWIRLVDRINFQVKLRNQQPPISRGMAVAIPILTITSLIPFVGVVTGLVNWLILVPIFASQVQGAINWLATEAATVRGQVGAAR